MATSLLEAPKVKILHEGKNFLNLLSQALTVAVEKRYSLVSAGDFDKYLDRFITSGLMKKQVALALLEGVFVKLIEGKVQEIDPSTHLLSQGFGALKDNVFSCHIRGDLVLTYQADEKNMLYKLLYLGSHANHPAYRM